MVANFRCLLPVDGVWLVRLSLRNYQTLFQLPLFLPDTGPELVRLQLQPVFSDTFHVYVTVIGLLPLLRIIFNT